MWNRKKDEEVPSRPAPVQPAPAQQPKEGVPVSTSPNRSYDPPTQVQSGSATIGKAVMVKGQIYSREDLVIDGEVEGTVDVQEHRLTVGPNGKVVAGIKARDIVVLGAIQGNVEAADKIEIRKDAKLVGDIKAARIQIEDGAYFKGSIDIVKPEPAKQQPVSQKAQQQAQAPMAATASDKR
jgi:cytoskeletal protein CcmA (bactofilin family)